MRARSWRLRRRIGIEAVHLVEEERPRPDGAREQASQLGVRDALLEVVRGLGHDVDRAVVEHAHVDLGPHPLGVPRVAQVEDLLEPLDVHLAVPTGAHLEHLVAVAEDEEVEQAVVPEAPEVALVVHEVRELFRGAPRLDARARHRSRQVARGAASEDDVRPALVEPAPRASWTEELHLPHTTGHTDGSARLDARLAGCRSPSSSPTPPCSFRAPRGALPSFPGYEAQPCARRVSSSRASLRLSSCWLPRQVRALST